MKRNNIIMGSALVLFSTLNQPTVLATESNTNELVQQAQQALELELEVPALDLRALIASQTEAAILAHGLNFDADLLLAMREEAAVSTEATARSE